MHALEKLMRERIATGLRQNLKIPCHEWVARHRMMGDPFPGPFGYTYHPWLYEMHDVQAEEVVGQKAAQMGYTEWAINVSLYHINYGKSVLYILPSSSDASDFSSARFDAALDLSPYLAQLFVDVNNVRLKRTKAASLYIRGSRSRAKLKSIPAPIIVLDEMDEMSEEAINLVAERQSGQVFALTLKLSTPSIEDFGINADYKLSTQKLYFFRCPGCSRYINLEYPRNFKLLGESLIDPKLQESYFHCHECGRRIDSKEKPEVLKHKAFGGTGHFVPTYPGRLKEGFMIHQMYSMSRSGREDIFAAAAMKAEFDATYAQEFWNSKVAQPYTARGAKVTDDQIQDCIQHYPQGVGDKRGVRTIGIDVGLQFHVIIYEWKLGETYADVQLNDVSTPKLLLQTTVRDESELLRLWREYQIDYGIIDAEPERRISLRLCQEIGGSLMACDYLFSQQGKTVTRQEDDLMVKVNRTAWLDQTMFRYRNKTIRLPHDIDEEFKLHIKEPVRITRRDKWGQEYGVYVNKKADHYAHASTYAELALTLLELGEVQTIKVY